MCFSVKSGMWTLRIQPPPVIPSTRGLKMKPGVSGHGSLGNILYDFTLCEWKRELDSKILTRVCKSSGPSVGKGQDPTGWSVFSFWAGPTTRAAFLPFSCPHSCPLGIFSPVARAAEQNTALQTLFFPHCISSPETSCTGPCLFWNFCCSFLPAFVSVVSFAWNVLFRKQVPPLQFWWAYDCASSMSFIIALATRHNDYLFTCVSSPMRLSQVWHWHFKPVHL